MASPSPSISRRKPCAILLTVHAQAITVPNIQKTVADYYQVRLSDLLSKRRSRSLARPRQMAMSLAKELTEHSLPEIGEAFGGRDHTTVLHACRTIRKLCETDTRDAAGLGTTDPHPHRLSRRLCTKRLKSTVASCG